MQSISITQVKIAKVYHLGSGSRSARAMTGDEASSIVCVFRRRSRALKGLDRTHRSKLNNKEHRVIGKESEMLNILFVYCVGTVCEVSVGPAPAEKPRESNGSTAGRCQAREHSHYSGI